MNLVVIVGDYNMFVSKTNIRRIDKTIIVVQLKLWVEYDANTYCGCLQHLLAKKRKEE